MFVGVNFYGGNWNIRGECVVREYAVGQISGSCLGKNFAGRGRVIFRGRYATLISGKLSGMVSGAMHE